MQVMRVIRTRDLRSEKRVCWSLQMPSLPPAPFTLQVGIATFGGTSLSLDHRLTSVCKLASQ